MLLENTERMMESTLLRGLPKWKRAPWRQRIRSAACYRAAFLNSPASAKRRQYLLRSAAAWPIPDFMPERGLALLQSLLGEKNYLTLRNFLTLRWGKKSG